MELSDLVRIFAANDKKTAIMITQTMTQLIADYFKTQPVLKAWIFGSFARGEQTADSDIDILVEFDKNSRVSLMKHAGMIVDLEQRLSRRVDLVTDGTLLPFAAKSADRDKILIYERAKYGKVWKTFEGTYKISGNTITITMADGTTESDYFSMSGNRVTIGEIHYIKQ